ncbi:MAG: hypothetical protein R3D98_05030 [Candidatus Krumholzibacteriia bacterium]
MKTLTSIVLYSVLGTMGTAIAEPVAIPFPEFLGEIPPNRVAYYTFPDDMADVDSIGIRLAGTLTEGIIQCWDDPEPRPTHAWPMVTTFHPDLPGNGWAGFVPPDVPPGDFDYTIVLNPIGDSEPGMFANMYSYIGCDVIISGPMCTVFVFPSADISVAELILYYGESTPVEPQTWSSVKGIFR